MSLSPHSSGPRITAFNAVATDLNGTQPRKKRKLNYSKCQYCRRSKKKCEPLNRQWPSEKCTRCAQEGLPCSEIVTQKAGGILQRRRTVAVAAVASGLEVHQPSHERSDPQRSSMLQPRLRDEQIPYPSSSNQELQESGTNYEDENKVLRQYVAELEPRISQLQNNISTEEISANASRGYIKATRYLLMGGSKQARETNAFLSRLLPFLPDDELQSVVEELFRPELLNEARNALNISLLVAARHNRLSTGKYLIERVSQTPSLGNLLNERWPPLARCGPEDSSASPLIEASCQGHSEFVDMLLSSPLCNAVQTDSTGTTAFCHAAAKGHEHVLKTFFAADTRPWPLQPEFILLTNKQVESALHTAIINGHTSCANALVRYGKSDLNAICISESLVFPASSPLALAIYCRRSIMIYNLLMQDGVNIFSGNCNGLTPRQIASVWSSRDLNLFRQLELILELQNSQNASERLYVADPSKPEELWGHSVDRRGQLDAKHRAEWDAAIMRARQLHADVETR